VKNIFKNPNMTPNTRITVTMTPKTRLKQALKKAGVKKLAAVTKLTVTGTMNGWDFRYIKENMGNT
jgi:hypothetical protein